MASGGIIKTNMRKVAPSNVQSCVLIHSSGHNKITKTKMDLSIKTSSSDEGLESDAPHVPQGKIIKEVSQALAYRPPGELLNRETITGNASIGQAKQTNTSTANISAIQHRASHTSKAIVVFNRMNTNTSNSFLIVQNRNNIVGRGSVIKSQGG